MKRLFVIFFVYVTFIACDPEGRKDCSWVLEPNPEAMNRADKGFVPVCARNRESMKQDCRMQATLEYAKSTTGKTFRYNDIDFESGTIPKKIKKIKFCK